MIIETRKDLTIDESWAYGVNHTFIVGYYDEQWKRKTKVFKTKEKAFAFADKVRPIN